MSWEKINFGSLYLAPTRNGIYKDKSSHGSGVKIVNMGEIFAYDFIGNQDMQRIEMTPEEMQTSGLKENDLLFARRSLVESGAGKASIVTELSEPTTFESSIIRVRLDSTLCYPLFYLYWLRCLAGRAAIGALVTGLNVKGIRGSELKGMVVDYPPIETQKRIAGILKRYDDLIENNQKQIKLLEEAAQRLYKEWFIDLRFPGHETTSITDGLPEGWTTTEVAAFGEIVTGKTPSTSKEEYYGGSIPFVKIPDMHNRVFPVTTEVCLTKEGADTQKNKYIPRNSLMVSCIATVGLVNIALETCQTNQQINSVILHNERDLYFMYFTLKQMKSLLDGVGSNGATMTNVNKTKFGKIPVVSPGTELRSAFYEWCEPVFRKIENLSRNIILLQEARDNLLPKLMNGEIEV